MVIIIISIVIELIEATMSTHSLHYDLDQHQEDHDDNRYHQKEGNRAVVAMSYQRKSHVKTVYFGIFAQDIMITWLQ